MADYHVNITNARKDLYKLAEMAVEKGVVVNINTKNGNAILISEEEYHSLLETIFLSTNSKLKETLLDGLKTPIEDTIEEKDVKW